MNIPKDKELYEKIKNIIYKQYDRPSAYRSGALVKKYKEEFKKKYGENIEPYEGDKKNKGPLGRWFKEEWTDYANIGYPVYRPQKRITKQTPLTIKEIEKKSLIENALIKQIIKDKKNLPPFKRKLKN